MSTQSGQLPLSELSPAAQRQNSPSWNQATRMVHSGDSASSYEISSSPRLFWQGRDSASPFQKNTENQTPYDPEASFFLPKRPSLENLTSVSRIKNSAMFQAHKPRYNPAQAYVPPRPLATGRLLQNHERGISSAGELDDQAVYQPYRRPPSPERDQTPPAKSSMSKASRLGAKGGVFDPGHEIWSDVDGYRHTKSVTFDAAPPQVNEYEMTTPDPSSIASGSNDGSYDSEEDEDTSSEHESSMDQDDSFDASLEDIEKTPVVLPDDWHFTSPHDTNDMPKEDIDDSLNNSEHLASYPQEQLCESRRSDDSNSERRPLPPLPSVIRPLSCPSRSLPQKLAVPPKAESSERSEDSPGPAPCFSQEATGSDRDSMPIDEKLRLTTLQDNFQEDAILIKSEYMAVDSGSTSDAEDANSASRGRLPANSKSTDKSESVATEASYFPPRISRDSILRDIRRTDDFFDNSYEAQSQTEFDSRRHTDYDADVPIASIEGHDEDNDTDANSVAVKGEEVDEDLHDIPQYYQKSPSEGLPSGDLQQHTHSHDDWDSLSSAAMEVEGNQSPRCLPAQVPEGQTNEDGVKRGSTEVPPCNAEMKYPPGALDTKEPLRRPSTPTDGEGKISEQSTPESVIHHSPEESYSDEHIPAPFATVKAHGASLTTRPSLSPADIESMAATRRKVSGQAPPPLLSCGKDNSDSEESSHDDERHELSRYQPQLDPPVQFSKKDVQRQSSLVKLDIPFSIQEESLGIGLGKEFDRVIESQKRGYLMRQNTRVIVASSTGDDETEALSTNSSASSRETKPMGSSSRKVSQQTWTTVPWNGKTRRASVKMSSGIPRKKPAPGAVPPLPGLPSNVQDTSAAVDESEPALDEAIEDGEERGRLFVKVVGMKNLDLPLPRGERSYFALTLDNGLHCVTTSWLELGRSAPVGQEFELVVQSDLEFHFTLQMKVDPGKFRPQETALSSPTRQKPSALSRVFASPRKRKEMEMKQQQTTRQQKSSDLNAGVWDTLRTVIARDGSFARAYVSLSDHEKHAFGRPYSVDVVCFNEWATEEQPSSVKSKRSTSSTNAQRKPPYEIGTLELQLLFVPKPKGAKDDDMPKSMNACIRELREAEAISSRTFEGFLSQQGGDCPFWRRRFFKLHGSKLTAFHETTRQPRATINLSKAVKLIDDRSSLVQKEITTKGGGRRKSAFAEEEEGYMFVEEGFRIRFGNGEVIDFYADNATDKESWLRLLSESVGKGSSAGNGQTKQWTEVVLRRERSTRAAARETISGPPAGGPPRPAEVAGKDIGPAPAARHKHTQSQPEMRSTEVRKNKTRSLVP